MSDKLFDSIGNISGDFIAFSDADAVQRHFKNKRKNILIRSISAAACLALLIGFTPSIIQRVRDHTDGPKTENASPPWTRAVTVHASTEKSVYLPNETPVLKIDCLIQEDILGKGSVEIEIKTEGFTVEQTEFFIGDEAFLGEALDSGFNISLFPTDTDGFGSITVYFRFYPDNVEEFVYRENLYNDTLSFGAVALSYVIDEYGIVFSRTRAPLDLFELRLVELYEQETIGAREFADRYFAGAYRDTVCASVDVMNADGSYRFIYRSKNIRYDSPYITDPAIKNAMNAKDGTELATLALAYMLENGVITQAEHDAELAVIGAARNIGQFDVGFDQNVASYSQLLQDNMYTH